MSDIVEMLVDAAGGNEAHVCAIAAAEIERNLSQIEQLDARCGRLRDTCSTWERASNNYAEAVEIKDAEIQRLRGLLREMEDKVKGLELANQDLVDERDSFAREIERLRDELAECERVGGKFMEEIERLRAADVLMVAQFESQEREITKLVRLLRECIDWVEFKEDPGLSARQIESEAMLVRRVREALGE